MPLQLGATVVEWLSGAPHKCNADGGRNGGTEAKTLFCTLISSVIPRVRGSYNRLILHGLRHGIKLNKSTTLA
uniref:Secreted protein n=1 Tax=Panagrellus redivivus TaxID=6233 RepID=A0A7E4W8U8_PANRE